MRMELVRSTIATLSLLALGMTTSSCLPVAATRIAPTQSPLSPPMSGPTQAATTASAKVPSTIGTATSTPPPQGSTPSPFPVATLSASQAEDLGNFLVSTGDCELPCWNHLTPGRSTPSEVPGFFASLGIDVYGEQPFQYQNIRELDGEFTAYPPETFPPTIKVTWENSYVESIFIMWNQYPEFTTPKSLLAKLGEPNAIQIVFAGGEAGSFYNILFVYDGARTTVILSGFGRFASDGTQEVCLSQSEKITASTLLLAASQSVQGIMNYHGFLGDETYFDWPSISGFSKEEIVHSLMDPTSCVPYFAKPN